MIDWIAGALASTKTAADIAKSLVTLRDEEVIRSRVFDLNASLMDLQQQMMTAQREQMALIEEVGVLKEALKVARSKTDLLSQYELLSVGPGKVVYAFKQEHVGAQPEHFCCTNCYDSGKRSVLKGMNSTEGWMNFSCPACKHSFGTQTTFIPKGILKR